MTIRTMAVSALAAAGLFLLPGAHSFASGGSAGISERSILVTVLDKDGVAVRDLTPADVNVREDGALREVTSITPVTDPLYVALLVDTGKPRMGQNPPVSDLRKGLAALVDGVQAAAPDTEISITEIAGAAVRQVDFTTSTDDLQKHIKRIFPSQRTGAVLLEGIIDAATSLKTRPSPRRAIVSVTLTSPESSTVLPRDVADAVQKAGAAFWAVSVEPPPDATIAQTVGQSEDPTLTAARAVILSNLPPATGGLRLTSVSPAGLESMCRKVAAGLTAQYVVTYATPATRPPAVIQATSRRGPQVLVSPWVQ